jgi:hypothetical protein
MYPRPYKRTPIIQIDKNLSRPLDDKPKGEYSLKQNFFDPSKSSPPNEFMLKLYLRVSDYNLKELSRDME